MNLQSIYYSDRNGEISLKLDNISLYLYGHEIDISLFPYAEIIEQSMTTNFNGTLFKVCIPTLKVI